jgi:hypothetical protein
LIVPMRSSRHENTPRGPAAVLAAAAACAVAIAFPVAASGQAPGTPATPIPGPLEGSAPQFEGAPATPDPIRARRIPRHPFMAPNGRSNLHNDAFQSDAYWVGGPLGRDPVVRSTMFARECASVAFDRRGRIVTICVGLDRPVLAILDPATLETIAAHPLPPRQASGDNPFTDFSGGGYFYLDHRDRAVIPTTTARLRIVAVRGDELRPVADYDLGPAVGAGAKVISALPDWEGRIWFAATNGVVGWIDPADGSIHADDFGERISNSFAVGQGGGVFVVTDEAMYRLEAGRDGPSTVWRRGYRNTGEQKSGQTSPGSGTTPTLLRRRYVAITDNADPLGVLVLDRARKPKRRRLVCRIPVLERGKGSTDQSLIGIGRAIVVENNYGYEGPSSTGLGATTEPGLERIDIRPRRRQVRDPSRNCRSRWFSDEIAPSVVPKVSLTNGLLYTYTKPAQEDGGDPWYLTALDFRTGETRFKILAGYGLGFNNNYAPVTIGPDGSAYVGVLGGIVRVADGAAQATRGGGR